jgi:glucose/arabinose dehydrogenase
MGHFSLVFFWCENTRLRNIVTYTALISGLLLVNESATANNSQALGLPEGTRLELLLAGRGVVWGIDSLSETRLLVAEKQGAISVFETSTKRLIPISGVPEVSTSGQGGLLDVKVGPSFKKDSRIFFTYSKKIETGVTTAFAVATLDLKSKKLSEVKDLFVGKTDNGGSIHFGSRIAFDGQGHVFLGIGDRGERDRAQELDWHNGKIIRLKLDGTIPKDNPFVSKKGALPEIYSYGHRNPQGLYYSTRLKKLFNSEHGPRGGDEVNEVKAGKNYGWPVITYGREYYGPKIGAGVSQIGMEQPIKYFVPSIAPSSLIVYESGKIQALKDRFILGALALQHLNVVTFDGKLEKRYLEKLEKRIRQVHETPSGTLLLGTDSGEIFRLSPEL